MVTTLLPEASAFASPTPLAFLAKPIFGVNDDSGSNRIGGVRRIMSGAPPRLEVADRLAPDPSRRRRGTAGGVRTGSVAVRDRRRRRRPRRGEIRDGGDRPPSPEDAPLDALEAASNFLSTPVPVPLPGGSGGSGTLPLAYPLALVGAASVFPPATAAVLAAAFASFLALGRTILNDDDDDEEKDNIGGRDVENEDDPSAVSDLVAFAGAVAVAGLLSPQGFVGGDGGGAVSGDAVGGISAGALLAGLGVVLTTVGVAGLARGDGEAGEPAERGGADRRLMDMWDEKMEVEEEEKGL